jgi:aminoglycoside phosphotransferase (APT) family kinase protein
VTLARGADERMELRLDERLKVARPLLERLLGEPLALQELKRKPARRLTLRATGRDGSAIVKLYVSDRARTVAARVGALASGPPEPLVPGVLTVDPGLRLVVLSDLHGAPLRAFAVAGDWRACERAGAVLGAWHRFWRAAPAPPPLAWHTARRECELLRARARKASPSIARTVLSLAAPLAEPWPCPTVVHRDLYEEQILLGDRAALIDLDDAALGPPELDVGNLLAHLELRALRAGSGIDGAGQALLDGYAAAGAVLDPVLLDRCRRLSLLRLVCIHREPRLLEWAESPGPGRRS